MINVIPAPQSVKYGSGNFQLDQSTRIVVSVESAKIGHLLADLLRPSTGLALPVVIDGDTAVSLPNSIIFHLTNAIENEEGYRLDSTSEQIRIEASTPGGLFYGFQTLRQLLPASVESRSAVANDAWGVTAVTIEDAPRFRWRGLMLDVCRHMFPIDFIKKYIDLMALHKFNKFHLHLTEDQGWRIEIKQYPQLTAVGSQRSATPFPADRNTLDGKPYGGYYTQEQLRDLVAYAQDRFITIVPEIELPGHSVAALTAYPHLGCRGDGYAVRTFWGIEEDVYCAGNEDTFTFLQNVLSEVMAIFPSEFIHIGGDECPKDRWKVCPKCQARIEEEELADEFELQSYFVRRIDNFLTQNGRRLVGWDEILEGGLAPNATVMSWRGSQGGIDAANAGHDVVMSPNTHCYLDYYQSEEVDKEPPAIGGYVSLEKIYNLNPLEGINEEQALHVLGGQANLWTEYIPTPAQAEYMTYPRASALAEVVWTAGEARDFEAFNGRLSHLNKRLDHHNVNYRTND